MVSFSVIIPTVGRPELVMTLASLVIQPLQDGDEVLVQRRDTPWGNASRQDAMERAVGTHLLFIDDDDVYYPGALAQMRERVEFAPERVHIFKMKYHGNGTLWAAPTVICGNVGTPMMAIPNVPGKLGRWTERYEADFDFLSSTLALHDEEPLFHDCLVACIKPPLAALESLMILGEEEPYV